MSEPIFITAAEVAKLTGFESRRGFLKHRARLEAQNNFPLPMITCLNPLKWRRSEVLAWVQAQSRFRPVGQGEGLRLVG